MTAGRARRRWVRITVAVLLAALAVCWSSGAASAHAELEEITPADGAIVAAAPDAVALRWSEPVSLTGGAARVLDDQAGVVSVEPVVDGTLLTIPLRPDLADGTYTVTWEVVSVDSHPISGATVFHVGAPSTGGPVDVPGSTAAGWGVRTGAAIFTWLAYAGALVAAGAWWFVVGGTWEQTMRRRIGSVVERAAVLASVSLVAAVPLRIARLGGGLGALRDNDLLAESLKGPVGVSSFVTATALLVLAGMAGRDGAGRTPDGLGALAGGVALAGFLLEGHTRSQRPRWPMASLDLIHLVAGAVWLGGIAVLVLAFRSRLGPDVLGRLVVRFSTVAAVAVVAVVAAGIGMALIVLPSIGDLISTGYGLALLTKAVLAVPVIALGAYNRRWLVPGMSVGAAAPAHQRGRLGRIVSAELILLLAVVGVTSVLVTRSPVASSATPPPATVVPPDAVELQLSGGAGTVQIAVAPARAGQNEILLVVTDASGQPLVPVEVPTVELTAPALGIGPLRPLVHPLIDGQYHVIAAIPLAGTYTMTIRVRVTDFTAATAETTVTIR